MVTKIQKNINLVELQDQICSRTLPNNNDDELDAIEIPDVPLELDD